MPATPRTTGDAASTDPPPAQRGERLRRERVSSPAVSGERVSREPRERRPGEDTLLSVPAPAPSFEVEVDDRLTALERHMEDVRLRVTAVEKAQSEPREEPPKAAPRWLIWVVFLLALAVAFQLFGRTLH